MDKIQTFITGPLAVNTYIIPVEGSGVWLIDPGGDVDILLHYLEQNQLSLQSIVLTHSHFDHLIALPLLKRHFPSAQVLIHSDEGQYLGKKGLARQESDFGAVGMAQYIRHYLQELPEADKLLQEGELLFDQWLVLHTPGHSPGSICLYSEADKVLFSGDTLFRGTYGRTDLPGGNYGQITKSLKRLLALPPETAVYPGHEGSTTILSEQGLLKY